MKSDAQLQQDVIDELKWAPCITTNQIHVSVAKGVVTLNGAVPSYAEKWAAQRAAKRVLRVTRVDDDIQVNPIGQHEAGDAEIAAAVATSLKWHVWVPPDIQVTVENGWVRLTGAVKWEFQRSAAENGVRYTAGVKGVSNEITIKSEVPPTGVQAAIEKALMRHAEIDASNVQISADGANVILSGGVRSLVEREKISSMAWNAPGVISVQDNLKIAFVSDAPHIVLPSAFSLPASVTASGTNGHK
jgi:osmotically-inducible protein OsmY